MRWTTDVVNHTATTANPGNQVVKTEMWYGTAAHALPHPFLRPACCRWKRPPKSFPRAESCLDLRSGIDHQRDSLRMLTRANTVVETRGVTWEAMRQEGASPNSLPETPEQRETMELGDDPEPRGPGDFSSAPMTPLPIMGRGILR